MKKRLLPILAMFCMIVNSVWADGFTVERAVNLGQLDSWTDISKFQWQEIDHGVLDNREEMDALKTLFYDPSPKDTVGFYNQIYKARDNQYIVLRLASFPHSCDVYQKFHRPFEEQVEGVLCR